MSTFTVVSEITDRRKVESTIPLFPCKVHKVIPELFEVYTGTKRKKFQGTVTKCKDPACDCYSYTADDVARKWNRNNIS
jgi:hypothetical protein